MKGFTRAIKNAHIKMLYQTSVKLICRIKPINEVHSVNSKNSGYSGSDKLNANVVLGYPYNFGYILF